MFSDVLEVGIESSTVPPVMAFHVTVRKRIIAGVAVVTRRVMINSQSPSTIHVNAEVRPINAVGMDLFDHE